MRKNYLFLIYILFCLPTLNAQDSIMVANKKSIVYFIRDELLSFGYTYEFYNDNQYIGGIKGLSYFSFECNSGNHLFWAAADNTDFLFTTLIPGETYIIQAKYKFGFFKGRVKLKLIDKNDGNYNIFKNKIISNDPVLISSDEIQKKNIKRKQFIAKSIERYNKQKSIENINNIHSTTTLQ